MNTGKFRANGGLRERQARRGGGESGAQRSKGGQQGIGTTEVTVAFENVVAPSSFVTKTMEMYLRL